MVPHAARHDCRIFQNKSAPDIIQQIFKDLGFSDYKLQLQGEASPADYCVQYRETDFNFVSRLMEEEGIFYFFKHEEGKHTLVLADQKSGLYRLQGKRGGLSRATPAPARSSDHITRWEHGYEFRSGKWSQTDYNFEDHPARNEPTPAKLLMTNKNTTVKLDNMQEIRVLRLSRRLREKKTTGDNYTKLRMEEDEAEYDVVHAASNCRTFTPGGKFKIKDHLSKSEEGKSYVITAIQHSASEPGAYETGKGRREDDYRTSFTCIPASVTFRPARITPKPVIHGSQTAVVGRPGGRGNLSRQVRPRQGAVLLGPRRQTRREELVLGPLSRRIIAGQGLGQRSPFPASARRWWSASWKATPTAR